MARRTPPGLPLRCRPPLDVHVRGAKSVRSNGAMHNGRVEGLETGMRLAFVIERHNYLRLFGPVIDRALARGWEVECWSNVAERPKGSGRQERRRAGPVFRHGTPRWRSYRADADLDPWKREAGPDAIIALEPPPSAMRSHGRWLGLQRGRDGGRLPASPPVGFRRGAPGADQVSGEVRRSRRRQGVRPRARSCRDAAMSDDRRHHMAMPPLTLFGRPTTRNRHRSAEGRDAGHRPTHWYA
jgi:hypothetical protein